MAAAAALSGHIASLAIAGIASTCISYANRWWWWCFPLPKVCICDASSRGHCFAKPILYLSYTLRTFDRVHSRAWKGKLYECHVEKNINRSIDWSISWSFCMCSLLLRWDEKEQVLVNVVCLFVRSFVCSFICGLRESARTKPQTQQADQHCGWLFVARSRGNLLMSLRANRTTDLNMQTHTHKFESFTKFNTR